MHIAEIDYLSNTTDSPLHRMRAVSKSIFSLLVLASFIISNNIYKLSGLILILLILFAIGKIPYNKVFHLVLYPLFFSLLFAFIRLQQSYILGLIVILKASGAALTMILLITTTPYVDIFALLSKFLPKLLVDIFLFTYRSVFILIEQMENLLKSMKLRGGYRSFNLVKNIKNIAGALGIMIIHSYDMNDRMYQIYTLRGYNGGIPITSDNWPLKGRDVLLIFFSVIILLGTVIPWSL
ncbi:energy-coupling factor transporter transmembrane component T family protein [Alkaliphilus peptidifermentans]|uniref:Cobalt/nickel transport system permease protein n=1 Tax=Alkaliphilus peptidifermentans DSM 18978 TaxID=1120976 RepID=A0A1G5KMU3_9FIRM|nr:energy-coupling factor transporter transmembrane component T [Alkaliphilus peptidifermentans]SCZ01249.1 cobalt/nickel transport system permease protein [Alkaliphilus peptidifermentans DSM 18978]